MRSKLKEANRNSPVTGRSNVRKPKPKPNAFGVAEKKFKKPSFGKSEVTELSI